MELRRLTAASKTVRVRLAKSGLRTVEAVALMDVKRKKVAGLSPVQLRALRKKAQRVIFEDALRRVKDLAAEVVQPMEEALRRATWSALEAARTAQERARDTIEASRDRARVLAQVAASKTKEAARRAEKSYGEIVRKLQRAPAKARGRLRPYASKAKRAARVAATASERAAEAVKLARQRASLEVRAAQARGEGLVDKLRRGPPPAPGQTPNGT